jgi:dicarboxylate/amino acid:cation (Na+ or H+) symporter, DAACS family
MKLWARVLIGLVAGVVLGAFLNYLGKGQLSAYLQPIGQIFLNLINMLVVLLVFSSMTVGITSIHDPKKLGRVGLKTILLFLVTTVIAVAVGLFFAYLLKPGVGVQLPGGGAEISTANMPSVKDILLSVVPRNPIKAFTEDDKVLQIIVFSIFLGIAINLCGEKARPLLRVIESLAETMYRLTNIVMEFAPYGVFAIMTWVTGNFGLGILKSLGMFLLANYLACIVQVVVVQGGILYFLARLNPLPFFKGMGDAIMIALSTNSSSATLPVTLHCARENLGVSARIADFVLPLGSTINMNGAAIFQGICAVFVAQAYGIDLSLQTLLTIVITALLSAVGAAGIPGTGYLMLMVVLRSAGLPTEGLFVIFGVDRIREMVSTIVNVLGDAVATVWVAKSEGELDIEQYNHAELVGFEESEV